MSNGSGLKDEPADDDDDEDFHDPSDDSLFAAAKPELQDGDDDVPKTSSDTDANVRKAQYEIQTKLAETGRNLKVKDLRGCKPTSFY